MSGWRAVLYAGFLLWMLPPPAAMAAANSVTPPVMVTPAPRLNLTRHITWCATGRAVNVAAIAAGGCHFVPATPAAMARGYSRRAFWLRMVLINPGPHPVIRWLRVGTPRLERVIFYRSAQDGWKRSEAGVDVPPSRRPTFSADPLLPLVLAPGKPQTVLVRVTSRTPIQLAPSLWRVGAYLRRRGRIDLLEYISIGAQLMAIAFCLVIYFQWNDLTYFFFTLSETAKTLFMLAYPGTLAMYLWPSSIPFDIRIVVVVTGCLSIFFSLFLAQMFRSDPRYRPYLRILFSLLALVVAPAMILGCLIDYISGMIVIEVGGAAIMAVAIALLFHAWRIGFSGAGLLLVSYTTLLADIIFGALSHLGRLPFSSTDSLIYLWGFLPSAPSALIAISARKTEMQRDLMLAQAESAARTDFLARMSHELRTPLDTILGTVQLLRRSNRRVSLADGLTDIGDSGRHLLRLIDDILDHARGLAGRLTLIPDRVDLPAFLRGIEHHAGILAARGGNRFALRLEGEPAVPVRLDEGRLRQVLDNLLVNAARHTRDGTIALTCAVGRPGTDGAMPIDFAVQDSGEGISPADQERIFRPFERGGGKSRGGGSGLGPGLGMGLTISRQIVERMGGRLEVDSRPGHGACFRFRIAAPPDTSQAASIPASDPARWDDYHGPRRTILVADDKSGSRMALTALLEGCGFTVVTAASGREAVDLCATARPDVVLTDQFMADGDGWMVLAALAERRPGLPVVLISAAPPQRPDRFPSNTGFAAHLMKPLDHAAVLRCLGELLALTWIERQPVETNDASDRTAIPPPAEELDDLRVMVANGQISDIATWAERLKTRDPACAAFADRVAEAAHRLDFPALEKLAAE